MIYVTSDLHFCHDKPFLFEPRGFTTINDHDNTIIKNWNSIVKDADEVYVLGDLMLMNNEKGISYIRQLKGKIHVILGNHDTSNRVALYKTCSNIVDICYATIIKYNKQSFYLSHYPTITSAAANTRKSGDILYNLFGHTHQNTNFYNDSFFMYHVGLDSHANCPITLDHIIEDCKAKHF